ncbi:hypothetical protein [Microbacterium sp. NC79]|uniref:hypothetical protein n=1 Tax=Microbacterium sp. NC79 TaxID=2851009 RepID=UPI001C2C24DC|nr:hypothetical protein [Microbacterium sp. NC79]MBV0894463.1 hypothetical protein [Microbacterium sp. NC79]
MDMTSGTMTVRFGGTSGAEARLQLQLAGVQLNEHAELLMRQGAFDAPNERSIVVVERSVAELGLADGGTLREVFAIADDLGLALVPIEAAPWIRLATFAQQNAPDSELSAHCAPTGSVTIASAPLTDDAEFPKGFYLRVVDDVAWLRGYRCDDTYVFGPEQVFLFAKPSATP